MDFSVKHGGGFGWEWVLLSNLPMLLSMGSIPHPIGIYQLRKLINFVQTDIKKQVW